MFPKYEKPLKWPAGWPRCARPGGYRSGFDPKRTIDKALGELMRELRLLGAGEIVFTANLRTGKQGGFLSDQPRPPDRGVAVWFKLPRREGEPLPQVLACDRWDRVEDNLHAIALHVESIRAQGRYGVGTLEQAFKGYLALPAAAPAPGEALRAQLRETVKGLAVTMGEAAQSLLAELVRQVGSREELERQVAEDFAQQPWWVVFNVSAHALEEEVEAAFWARAELWHPDRGGLGAVMTVLNQKRKEASQRPWRAPL